MKLLHSWLNAYSSPSEAIFCYTVAQVPPQVPFSFELPWHLFEKLLCRRHIAQTWPHLTRTEFSHAGLQTFILLSSAKSTTIANLHTLRWSGPDFKRSPRCRPCGRREMPHKTTVSTTYQLSLPVCLWQSSEGLLPPCGYNYCLFPSTSSFIHNNYTYDYSAILIEYTYSVNQKNKTSQS